MSSIKRNYILNLSYQILSIIIPLITTPYVARVLGAYNIGINSYVNSVQAYFILFAALGTAFYGQREIARLRDNKEKASQVFWEIEFLSIITAVVCVFVWLFFVLHQSGQFEQYFWALTIGILAVAFDITWLFAGFEQFDKIVIVNLFVKLISVILIFLLVKNSDDLIVYICINSVTTLIANLSMWGYVKKTIYPPTWRDIRLKYHFQQTMVYFLPTIATTIYTVMDKTMLQVISHNLYENGYYEQAEKICRIPMTVLLSMDTVMSSRMSFLLKKDISEEARKRLELSIGFIGFLGIPMVVGIDLIIKQFVPWFLGEGYDGVVKLVYLYSPLIFCIGVNSCLSEQYLTPKGKRKQTAIIVALSALINFVLNLILIPQFNARAVAVTSVISEAFIAIVYMFMCKDIISLNIYFEKWWKNFMAAMIMFIVVFFLTENFSPNIWCTCVQIILGGIIYLLVLFVLKDSFFRKILSIAKATW